MADKTPLLILVAAVASAVAIIGYTIWYLFSQVKTYSVTIQAQVLGLGIVTFIATPHNLVNPISYFWDFGDGSTLTSSIPFEEYAYGASGTYEVAVIATDVNNNVGTGTTMVTVNIGL